MLLDGVWRFRFLKNLDSNLRQHRFSHLCGKATWISNSPWNQPGLAGASGQTPKRLVGWIRPPDTLGYKKICFQLYKPIQWKYRHANKRLTLSHIFTRKMVGNSLSSFYNNNIVIYVRLSTMVHVFDTLVFFTFHIIFFFHWIIQFF